jgi:hypothetical protein
LREAVKIKTGSVARCPEPWLRKSVCSYARADP